MTIHDKIRDATWYQQKMQHDINIEATKISAVSSNKVDTFEYVAGEEILPSNLSKILT